MDQFSATNCLCPVASLFDGSKWKLKGLITHDLSPSDCRGVILRSLVEIQLNGAWFLVAWDKLENKRTRFPCARYPQNAESTCWGKVTHSKWVIVVLWSTSTTWARGMIHWTHSATPHVNGRGRSISGSLSNFPNSSIQMSEDGQDSLLIFTDSPFRFISKVFG